MDINSIEIETISSRNSPLFKEFSIEGGKLLVLKCKPGIYLRVFMGIDKCDFLNLENIKAGENNFITDYYVCHPEDLDTHGRYSAFSNLMPKNSFIGIEIYSRMVKNLVSDVPKQLGFEEKYLPSYEEYKELCQYAFAINLLSV